jgi:hypothetical protein
MFKLLMAAAFAFLILASFARAQEYEPRLIAMAIANDIDAVLVDCPIKLDPPAACYRYSLDVDWLKMKLENFVRGYDDIRWLMPWNEDRGILGRVLELANGDAYMVFLVPDGRSSIGYVQFMSSN